jgi:hypothetical protein
MPAAASVHHAHASDARIDAMRRRAAARLRMRAWGWCARAAARGATRAAPRAEKLLAPQFYLVQFTGFYKYLKKFSFAYVRFGPHTSGIRNKNNMMSRDY